MYAWAMKVRITKAKRYSSIDSIKSGESTGIDSTFERREPSCNNEGMPDPISTQGCSWGLLKLVGDGSSRAKPFVGEIL